VCGILLHDDDGFLDEVFFVHLFGELADDGGIGNVAE
jgi:hypothetical protein